ncbi:MFS transporter [Knoellia remsis]|uniref:MFS transporter n=1 Tax=Knoellia remsis TaxID=407159 RepID=A0A2T0UN03_9MICO|nr:MFS transporter [Knoellia remsis]PRY59276.1 MFS transporter [Knoellia remsis]
MASTSAPPDLDSDSRDLRDRPDLHDRPGQADASDHLVVDEGTPWTSRVWLLVFVLGAVLFLDGLDLSMIGVALPETRAALDLDPSAAQWLISGYILGYGGFLLLGGRACDLIGRRQVFLAAVLVFGVASVVSALVDVGSLVVLLRFVKGVAAAFTVPAGLSIITTTFAEGAARNRAFSIYTVCGASGFSLGLVAGGLLTEISWRAALFFPGPVALALFALGWKVIPHSVSDAFSLRRVDVAGALTSTLALLLLVLTVVRAPEAGWGAPVSLAGFAGAALLMTAFVVIELRHPHPLVRLGILRSPELVHANLAGLVMFGGYAAFQFLVSLYLQEQLGWSAIGMALGFLPAGLIVLGSALRIDRLLNRADTRVLVAAGLTSFSLAYGWFLLARPEQSYVRFLLPTMVLLGIGFAILFPAVNAQATAGVADHEQGLASGLLNTFIQVGGALMIAVVTAITATAGAGRAADPTRLPPGMVPSIAVVITLTVAGLLGTLVLLGRRPRVVTGDAPVPAEVTRS